ncbi:MAG: metal-dependent hydrolase [Bacteroidia bacterium]|nr:metal-dependent hydrolase [Bacteroidia bacterium]
MDLLTLIVFGAAVGEYLLGKKVGYRGAFWGAIVSLIPELDRLAVFFGGEVAGLVLRQTVTHSLLIAVLLAPVMGHAINRLYRGQYAQARDWAWLVWWVWVVHLMLDACTVWGPQLLYPMSTYRLSLGILSALDPLLITPVLIWLLIALRAAQTSANRRLWNGIGLVLAGAYFALSLANRAAAESIFKAALHNTGRSTQRYIVAPTPSNTLYWYVVAEGPDQYEVGYYSILADERNINFTRIPRRYGLPDSIPAPDGLDQLIQRGYSTLDYQGDTLYWHDQLYGLLPGQAGPPAPTPWLMSLRWTRTDTVWEAPSRLEAPHWLASPDMRPFMWDRILGRPQGRSSVTR